MIYIGDEEKMQATVMGSKARGVMALYFNLKCVKLRHLQQLIDQVLC